MRRRWVIALVSAALVFIGVPRAIPAHAAAVKVTTKPKFTGLTSPVLLTNARDGSNRLFVLEQAGMIKVAQAGATTLTNFLDIRTRVSSGGERGLLGLAFHPSYETNGRFFVFYTALGGDVTISEFHVGANPNVGDPNSEQVLVTIEHSQFSNHNGGMIEFGPDGLLYAGVGDGGSANDPNNNGQNASSPLGKMHRLNVDVTPVTDAIYAIGFRNPWRFSFDRVDGHLVVGDVGQSQREEIDIVLAGGNYGWRAFEGTVCTNLNAGACANPSQYVMPITQYAHTKNRCSVTGGYVYRGNGGAMPKGTYLYGDYCTGEIFSLKPGQTTTTLAKDTTLNISSFGEDEAGELYVVNLGGTVKRIAAAPAPCQQLICP